MEIWKDIVGYEQFYQISNYGRVRSLDRYVKRCDGVIQFKKGIIKSPKVNEDGYRTITLSKNGEDKTIGIHILVAKHFVDNPYNLPEVNHIDFDRQNNYAENLEWCTHKDNIKHSSDNGRYKLRDFTGKNNPNYGNHKLSEIYRQNKDLAIEKLSRPAEMNGRAVKIELYDIDMNYVGTFDWIGGCCQYLIENKYSTSTINGIRSRIEVAIKSNKPYLKHYFKKIA